MPPHGTHEAEGDAVFDLPVAGRASCPPGLSRVCLKINLQKFTLRGARQRIILAHIAHHTVRFARAALAVAVSFLVCFNDQGHERQCLWHFSHL